ncbi:hypothetical protein [uncultured Acinetobacter sp.]|uniref:hypothetical protein n=1 Tax=uncultured Acinetobacter sp. TaxID=165433 RepID=UPI0037491822
MFNIPFTIQSDNNLDYADLLPQIPQQMVARVSVKLEPLQEDEEKLIQRICSASETASAPILHGISAIGELLALSATDVSQETISNIGWLINSLGNEAAALSNLKTESEHLLKQNRKVKLAHFDGGMTS